MVQRKPPLPEFLSGAIAELNRRGLTVVRSVEDRWFAQCFAASSRAVVRFELDLRDQAVHVHVAAVADRDSLASDLRNAPGRFQWISLRDVLKERAPAEVLAPEFPAGTPFGEQARRQAAALITHCRDLLDGNFDAVSQHRSDHTGPPRQPPDTQQMRGRLTEMIGDEKLAQLLKPDELDAIEGP